MNQVDQGYPEFHHSQPASVPPQAQAQAPYQPQTAPQPYQPTQQEPYQNAQPPENLYAGSGKTVQTQNGPLMKISFSRMDLQKLFFHLNEGGWVTINLSRRQQPSPSGSTHYGKIDLWRPQVQYQVPPQPQVQYQAQPQPQPQYQAQPQQPQYQVPPQYRQRQECLPYDHAENDDIRF